MKKLTIKEFLKGTVCWNCKIKDECMSYQATKDGDFTVTDCAKTK